MMKLEIKVKTSLNLWLTTSTSGQRFLESPSLGEPRSQHNNISMKKSLNFSKNLPSLNFSFFSFVYNIVIKQNSSKIIIALPVLKYIKKK